MIKIIYFVSFIILCCLVHENVGYFGERKLINVGGIFHNYNNNSEVVFALQLQRRSYVYDGIFTYVPNIQRVSELDSYKSGKLACSLANSGVAAIIGPHNRQCSGIVSSICHNLKIPHFQTHWDPAPAKTSLTTMTLKMYPDAEVLAIAYADVIKAMEWKSFTVVYEDDDAFIRLQQVLRAHTSYENTITVRQLHGHDHRALLKDIQASGEIRIILDASPQTMSEVLQQAMEVNMLGEYMQYFLATLDAHTISFGPVKYDLCNITSLRIVNPTTTDIRIAVDDLKEKFPDLKEETFPTEMALVYDAVSVFYNGTLLMTHANYSINTRNVSCNENGDSIWPDGEKLFQFLCDTIEMNAVGFDKIAAWDPENCVVHQKSLNATLAHCDPLNSYTNQKKSQQVKIDGLTGPIQFDEYGRRKYFKLEFVELVQNGFNQIATWDPENGVVHQKSLNATLAQYEAAIRNKTFKVVSRIGAPYLMWNNQSAEGNERFRGFALDLIDALANHLGFKYQFELARDGLYGSYNKKTKKWDGLIKELLDRQADLAICDLTITYDRRSAVDFTKPFMTLGISILYRKQEQIPPALFSFMEPLSFGVWMYTVTAFLFVSFFIYLVARMCPKDWENPHPCNLQPEELENIWCLKNCIWLSLGSFMCQGCDILPKGTSTRVATACWWFFALIITQSYCANLTAFLTSARMENPITSAEDLARQTKIKYGVVKGGSTGNFFKESNFSTYQKMWSVMEATRPSVFVADNNEGIERVKNGKGTYAFIMESTTIEYATQRNCELTQIGGKLDSKGYGIAMPVNSPYRTQLSQSVLKLQEEGKLQAIKTKWWKEMDGGGKCDISEDSSGETSEMGVETVAGVFVLLGIGCAVSFLISILEFLWNIRKVAVENKISPCDALTAELKFAIQIYNKTKPVKTKLSESSSEDNRSIATSVLRGASSFLRLDTMFDKKESL